MNRPATWHFDIRVWIALFFLIRLTGITHPPLEIGHNWRQSLTNMIARNFVEEGPDLFHPKIDMAGNQSGIIGSEFPFFNFLIYLPSVLFGYEHWYGRLINVIVSSFGIYAFYLLAIRIFNQRIAFISGMLLLSSIWFAFSRKIMPDTFSISLIMIGLLFACRFVEKKSLFHLIISWTFITLGGLCKIPAICLLGFLVIPFFSTGVSNKTRYQLVGMMLLSSVVIAGWYFYWVPHLVAVYQYPLFFPRSLTDGLAEILPRWKLYTSKFYFESLASYLAIPFLLVGTFFLIKEKNRKVQLAFSAVTVAFILFTIKTGIVFPTHNYYIIPFTPVLALVAGYGISQIRWKYWFMIPALIMTEGILNQQHDFFLPKGEQYKTRLEDILDRHTDDSALIVINGGASPQLIYFANRRGWSVEADEMISVDFTAYKKAGASVVVLDRHKTQEALEGMGLIYEDDDFRVYGLE